MLLVLASPPYPPSYPPPFFLSVFFLATPAITHTWICLFFPPPVFLLALSALASPILLLVVAVSFSRAPLRILSCCSCSLCSPLDVSGSLNYGFVSFGGAAVVRFFLFFFLWGEDECQYGEFRVYATQ